MNTTSELNQNFVQISYLMAFKCSISSFDHENQTSLGVFPMAVYSSKQSEALQIAAAILTTEITQVDQLN